MSEKITFVCCIEYGNLENQTVLMIKSFRKNAGALKDSRFLAVVGRGGVQLHKSTIDSLRSLSVEIIYNNKINPVKWFNYSNKIVAVKIAQEVATTELVAWLDSDILVANCPNELILDPEIDFAARGEFLPPAIHSQETVNIPYWKAICTLLEADFELLPTINLEDKNQNIKMYFNSGVFVWRRSSDFAALYYDAFVKVLKSRIAQHDGVFFTADQIIIGPILIKSGMRWKHLRYKTHHMTFQFQITGAVASPDMSESSLIHYSKSLSDVYKDDFLIRLKRELPELCDFVQYQMKSCYLKPSGLGKVLATALKVTRGLQWKLYALRVRRVSRG